jgi:predicted lipoprotein with Yx(FWY)xxD motif
MSQVEWRPTVAQTLETAPGTSGTLSLVRFTDGTCGLLRHGRPIPVMFSDEREGWAAFEYLVAAEARQRRP